MEDKYYVCIENKGISHYDLSNDSMSAMKVSTDKNDWISFSLADAKEIARQCDYNYIKISE